MKKKNQMEDLFGSCFLNREDTEYAFQCTDKAALRKAVKDYQQYLKGKYTPSSDTFLNGIGIECNDEQILFSVKNLYRLWKRSPYWLQKKDGQTLYVLGISFCEKFESFIIGGYLEPQNKFVAIQWRQPVNTIGLLADAIVSDYVPDAVRMKKETPLYRLFTFACTD